MLHASNLKILVAPLDWGLGHTTRCIPVISRLLEKGAEVLLAGNEVQHKILGAEFPQCRFLPLEGYSVKYASSGTGFMLKMMRQLPRILSVIKAENAWLKQVVSDNGIHGVISDNRFGLYHAGVPCVFITHQLQVKTGMGRAADILARSINYKRIGNFSACWVPDFKGPVNLGGELSHPAIMPAVDWRYIGPLSRVDHIPGRANKKHILFIMSGPEPQRTVFENKVFEKLEKNGLPVVIVRGRPLDVMTPVLENAVVYNHLPKGELLQLMREAEFIICRSGYSSVMDINAIQAKAILIPTPGQTEQEYLANHLMKNKFALSGSQQDLDVASLLDKARQFSYEGFIEAEPDLLSGAIDIFLQNCSAVRSAIL